MNEDESRVHCCCSHRDCSWSIVSNAAEEEGNSPRCVSGSLMERVETIPVMTYVDFRHRGMNSRATRGNDLWTQPPQNPTRSLAIRARFTWTFFGLRLLAAINLFLSDLYLLSEAIPDPQEASERL